MKITPTKLRKPLFGFLVSTVIFALLNILFKYLQFLPHYADFRISAFYPVMAGMFFGPWGALGCALGNLISDFFGTLNYESWLGMLANFLFAWLPYRLWHTILPCGNHKVQFVSSTKTLVKYTLIASFSTMASMAVLASGCDLFGVFDFSEFFRPVFLCNLYFALFLGTTFFLLASILLPIEFYVPKKLYTSEYCHKRYIPDYLLCAVITIAVGFRYILSKHLNDTSALAFVTDIVIFAGVLILAFLPLRRSKKPCCDNKLEIKKDKGLQMQIITAFFIVISVSTLCLVFFLLNNLSSFNGVQYTSLIMQDILKMVNLFGFVFIFVLIITLVWIEKRISKPIMKLAETSNKFVENGLYAEIPDYSKLSVEISVLAQSYKKMSADIESYVSTIETQAKREEYARLMLEMSAKIQLGMLPKPLTDSRFLLSSFIKPARTVGGDFYYYTKLDDDRLLLCIADVSSKGMPAAMFAAEACMLVKCSKNLSIEEMLANVNNNLCEINSEDMFVTMFAGIIDANKRRLEFVNAGHNYPIIWNGKAAEWLKSEPDLVLGLFSNTTYHLNSIDINDDFQILLYTDGVVESENINHSFFGNENLESLCKSLNTKTLETDAQLGAIIKQIEKFTYGAEQSDDITAVIARTCR